MTRKELLSTVVPRKVTVPLSLRPWWGYDPDAPAVTNTATIDGPTWADKDPATIMRDIDSMLSVWDSLKDVQPPDPRDTMTTFLSERTIEARTIIHRQEMVRQGARDDRG